MEGTGRKRRADPARIDERSILEKVAALGAQGVYTSSTPKHAGLPQRKPPPDGQETYGEKEAREYIESHLNGFQSSGRNPLHIDAEAYRLLSDLVWIVRRKDFTIAGVASRIIIDHFKEKAGLIEKIKEHCKKRL